MHNSEGGSSDAIDRRGGQGDIGPCREMLSQKRPVIHPVELVTTRNQVELVRSFKEVAQILTNSVSSALVPAGRLGRLLGGEYLHEVLRKIIKFIAGIYVAMQRRTVELRQYIHSPQLGVETVADRYINQSIFSGQRHRGLCSILGQRKQACSGSAAHDDGECFVVEGRAVHC